MAKALLLSLLLAALLVPFCPTVSAAFSHDVGVKGHFRQDGTYVKPHRRTYPDSNPYNNYGTYPNVNPYTGQQGTRRYDSDPFRTPSYDYSSPWGSSPSRRRY
jgi:hypothetical protein